MAEPKATLEAALWSLLDTALSYNVYNTRAAGSMFEYVVFQAVGGDDQWYAMKKRGWQYDYQVVGVHTSRATALAMNASLDVAMAGALSVTGYSVVSVVRTDPVDYTQVLEDGQTLHYVGGVYRIELEEV